MDKAELELVLKSVEKDLTFFREPMEEVALEMVDTGLSNHPVFIMHQAPTLWGEPFLDAETYETTWSLRVSSLEKLIEEHIIDPEKRNQLAESYEQRETACVLLLAAAYSRFLFFPFKSRNNSKGKSV